MNEPNQALPHVILFRGDSVGATGTGRKDHRGRTFAEFFCGNGIMAKHADCGWYSDIAGRPLLDLVLEHVGVDRGAEETYRADHSPLISFSTNRDIARRFSNRGARDLEDCDFEDATHFLWRFEPTLEAWRWPGTFVFKYRADPKNCRDLVQAKVDRGMSRFCETGDQQAFGRALMEHFVLGHAEADASIHQAYVVDVVSFLGAVDLSRSDQRLVQNALLRCQRDAEWLVMPADPMPDGKGFDARLQMNGCLFPEGWSRKKATSG